MGECWQIIWPAGITEVKNPLKGKLSSDYQPFDPGISITGKTRKSQSLYLGYKKKRFTGTVPGRVYFFLVFWRGLYYNEILNDKKEVNRMKKQRNQGFFRLDMTRIWLVLLLLWVLLIFGHSLTPAELSSRESGWVMDCLLKVLKIFGSEGSWLTGYIVRKGAHFTEYFIFGVLLIQNFHGFWKSAGRNRGNFKRNSGEKLFPLMLAVLAVPFCDETIQLFVAGRAGQIPDVWLDISGAVCGILFREAAAALSGKLSGRLLPRRKKKTGGRPWRR